MKQAEISFKGVGKTDPPSATAASTTRHFCGSRTAVVGRVCERREEGGKKDRTLDGLCETLHPLHVKVLLFFSCQLVFIAAKIADSVCE